MAKTLAEILRQEEERRARLPQELDPVVRAILQKKGLLGTAVEQEVRGFSGSVENIRQWVAALVVNQVDIPVPSGTFADQAEASAWIARRLPRMQLSAPRLISLEALSKDRLRARIADHPGSGLTSQVANGVIGSAVNSFSVGRQTERQAWMRELSGLRAQIQQLVSSPARDENEARKREARIAALRRRIEQLQQLLGAPESQPPPGGGTVPPNGIPGIPEAPLPPTEGKGNGNGGGALPPSQAQINKPLLVIVLALAGLLLLGSGGGK